MFLGNVLRDTSWCSEARCELRHQQLSSGSRKRDQLHALHQSHDAWKPRECELFFLVVGDQQDKQFGQQGEGFEEANHEIDKTSPMPLAASWKAPCHHLARQVEYSCHLCRKPGVNSETQFVQVGRKCHFINLAAPQPNQNFYRWQRSAW